MIIAGVELRGGRRVWARAASIAVQPLDRVLVREGDAVEPGIVFLAPEHMIMELPTPDAFILSRIEPETRQDRSELPGADMPPLGSRVRHTGENRCVCGIDPVKRTVTLGDADDFMTVSIDEIGDIP